LPQYNAPKEQEDFVLDFDGAVDLDVKARQDLLLSRKEIAGKNLYSLDSEKVLMGEYYTQQEMVQFKKRNDAQKKKKKIRKKEKLELNPLPNQSIGNDLGSRTDSVKLKLDQMKEDERKEKNEKGYNVALEKAKEETQLLFEEEKEDSELSKTLMTTREMSLKKKIEVANLTAKFEEKNVRIDHIKRK